MIHFVTYCLLCIFLSNSLCSALPTPSQEKPLVIVSCSGKSGSTTLESSFKHLNIETYRFHRITDSMYETISSTKRPVLLLDSMRDIISRKIASYFHHLANHLNLPIAEILNIYQTNPKLLFEKIQKQLDEKILKIAHFHSFHDWKKLGYYCLEDSSFDFEKRYQLKKVGNLYFVNLRFDDIKDWQTIISSLDIPFSLTHFKLISANQSENKWYNEIYKEFLPLFTISRKNFYKILRDFSAELNHFYTQKEKRAFLKKWQPHLVD